MIRSLLRTKETFLGPIISMLNKKPQRCNLKKGRGRRLPTYFKRIFEALYNFRPRPHVYVFIAFSYCFR